MVKCALEVEREATHKFTLGNAHNHTHIPISVPKLSIHSLRCTLSSRRQLTTNHKPTTLPDKRLLEPQPKALEIRAT